MDVPKIKKKLNAFLVSEDGKISKEALMKTGIIATTLAIGTALSSPNATAPTTHSNDLNFEDKNGAVRGFHEHHASHSSHGSHGSHSSGF